MPFVIEDSDLVTKQSFDIVAEYDLGELLCSSLTGDVHRSLDSALIETYGVLDSSVLVKKLPSYFNASPCLDVLNTFLAKHNVLNLVGQVDLLEGSEDEKFLVYSVPPGEMLCTWVEREALFFDDSQLVTLLQQLKQQLELFMLVGMQHGMIELNSIFVTTKGELFLLDSVVVAAKQELLEKEVIPFQMVPNGEAITASPEVCFGRDKNPEDDVFNLSVLFYQLQSGQHPYDGKNSVQALLGKMQPEPIDVISVGQWKALQKGLALQGENRFTTLDILIEKLFATSELNVVEQTLLIESKKPSFNSMTDDTSLKSKVFMNLWLLIPVSLGSASGVALMSHIFP